MKYICMLALMVPTIIEAASVSELKRKYEQKIQQEAKEMEATLGKSRAVKPAVPPVVAPMQREVKPAVPPVVAPMQREVKPAVPPVVAPMQREVKPVVISPVVDPIKKAPEKPIQKKKMNQKEATQLLITGIEEGNAAKVKEALDQGADKDTFIERRSALMNAVIGGNVEIARLLLSAGARLSDLELAETAINGDEKMAAMLLRSGKITQEAFDIAFDDAFKFGRANIVRLFIQGKHFFQLNQQSAINGQTLLMRAVEYGHKNIVALLLSYKADPQLKDNNGLTALDYALLKGREDMVALFTAEMPNAQEEIKKAWSRIRKYEKRKK